MLNASVLWQSRASGSHHGLRQWQYYLEGVKGGVTVVTNPRAQHLLRQKTGYATVMSSDGMVVESWQELQA